MDEGLGWLGSDLKYNAGAGVGDDSGCPRANGVNWDGWGWLSDISNCARGRGTSCWVSRDTDVTLGGLAFAGASWVGWHWDTSTWSGSAASWVNGDWCLWVCWVRWVGAWGSWLGLRWRLRVWDKRDSCWSSRSWGDWANSGVKLDNLSRHVAQWAVGHGWCARSDRVHGGGVNGRGSVFGNRAAVLWGWVSLTSLSGGGWADSGVVRDAGGDRSVWAVCHGWGARADDIGLGRLDNRGDIHGRGCRVSWLSLARGGGRRV